MKKYILIIGFGALIVFSSCVNTKKFNSYWIYKNQVVYSNYDSTLPNKSFPKSHIKAHKIKKGVSAQIKDKDGELKISNIDRKALIVIKDTIIKSADGSKTHFHYPSILTEHDTLLFRKNFMKDKPSFKYLGINPMVQASTIPFKFRPKQDSINGNVSTSGNLGFVFGLKFTNHKFRNIYDTKGKRFNTFKTSIAITPGVFLGPTTVGLTAGNTGNNVKQDITVLGLNSGFLLVFGVNKFNIGGAIGFDFAFGDDGTDWIYNGKPWYGFVLSLDFIK